MLNSVARLPHGVLPTSTTVNVKLDPSLLATEEGLDKITALIKGHFLSGGQQLQFNFYDRELLLDAKKHPERHGNLMVRVAGYSAPFVSLWEDLQDRLITGELCLTPRMDRVPVSIPLPPAPDASSIFRSQQSGGAKSAFARR